MLTLIEQRDLLWEVWAEAENNEDFEEAERLWEELKKVEYKILKKEA